MRGHFLKLIAVGFVLLVSGLVVIGWRLQATTNSTSRAPVGISAEEDAKIPPLDPRNIKAYVSDQVVRLEWGGVWGGDGYYFVYRKAKGRPWEQIGKVKAAVDYDSVSYNFEDHIPDTSQTYFYSVSAVSSYGLEGQLSTPVEVTLEGD
ncbi:MAG: hypothetical protein Q8Q24_00485 [bacterium]|nr:hypothetical protein [bacterium]